VLLHAAAGTPAAAERIRGRRPDARSQLGELDSGRSQLRPGGDQLGPQIAQLVAQPVEQWPGLFRAWFVTIRAGCRSDPGQTFRPLRRGHLAGMRPFDDIARLDRAQILDRPATAIRDVVQRLLANRTVADALHGVWLGHPLHPALAQVALGSFLSASLLDALPDRRSGSDALIVTGLAATLPTATSGWADWAVAHEDQQRTGLVHAASNGTAAALYLAALLSRRGGGSGRALSLAGGLVAGFGAMLGGHLGYRQALGANHAEDVAHIGPADWQDLGPLAELPDGRPARRTAGQVPVFVLRRGTEVTVLSDRCPHLSAPLSEGELVGTGSDTRVVCPWHASEFRVDDGCVVHGPATAPAPRFESRVTDGVVQARVVTIPGVPAS
jgi:nitrite reductase/ring-hydroxylating ferredoxin subunit